ncbi:MAG: lysylphosphatidylglycerol synthase transmembrane domain-containing protein [Anaerolineae bacterium]
MNNRNWNRSLLIASLMAVAISGISLGVEWNNAQTITLQFSALALALVLAAAITSYVLRILRFHLLLSASGIPVSLRGTALAQGIGFALSITPGSIGEVFKLYLIRQRAGTALMRAAPALLLDRALEGAGFLVLALVSTAALPAFHVPLPNLLPLLAGLSIVLLLGTGLYRSPRLRVMLKGFLARSRLAQRFLPQATATWRELRATLTTRRLASGLILTALARIADGLVLLFAAQMMGIPLALPIAIFVIAASGLAGGVSLLPGGTGATEATMAGLLMLVGASFATALAIAILARFCTLWLWVGLGLGEAFTFQLAPVRAGQMP